MVAVSRSACDPTSDREGKRRMTEFAPVPEFATGPAIPESGYRVTELGEGAYGITSGMVNTIIATLVTTAS